MKWEAVIGLEIHARLKTRSKIFSAADAAYSQEPNLHVCAIDAGLPGVLPVPNAEAVRMAIAFGLAIGAEIAQRTLFVRKSYFYPDLPKGYQISQFESPIVHGGAVEVSLHDGSRKTVRLIRAHLEEDAGRSEHDAAAELSRIDLNRAGTALIEIVSEPDMHSVEEAGAYMRKIHSLVCYLGICDGNMQEGSLRCDANVSLRPAGSAQLGVRSEIKNLNSFHYLEQALEYEIQRHTEALESGGVLHQETRLYDANNRSTRLMRRKEESDDYRYFPDPDLLPLLIDEAMIAAVRDGLPEPLDQRRDRLMAEYNLSASEAERLLSDRAAADYFERCAAGTKAPARHVMNWLYGEMAAFMNKNKLSISLAPIDSARLANLLDRVEDGALSGKMAKRVFAEMWSGGEDADAVIERQGLKQLSDAAGLQTLIDQVIAAHPEQHRQYLSGKKKVFSFFVGQIMKASKGRANPAELSSVLRRHLDDKKPR